MKNCIVILALFLFNQLTYSQKIMYSEPDRNEIRELKYEIIGKINSKVLVYKTSANQHSISVYDAEMKQLDKVNLDYLTDRVFNVDFVIYDEYAYLFYQYQKRNIIYCNAVKIDGNGKKVGEIYQLDTTDSREVQNNKIYSFVQSFDKSKIQFYKINTSIDKVHQITTLLFDRNLSLLSKASEAVPMRERNSFLTSFEVDNNGNFGFLKAIGSNGNESIAQLILITKSSLSKLFKYNFIAKKENVYLDEVKLKIDNTNDRFIITSLYSNKRRGDIQGLYASIWDNSLLKEKTSTLIAFDGEFRNDANTAGSTKTAFNDFFIKDIIVKKDGGFLLTSENEYTSTRGNNNFNRWDNLNNMSTFGNGGFYSFGSPGFNSSPWNRFGNSFNVTRYFSENVAIMSLDSIANLQWTNVIRKSQFDDNSDAMIGFGLFNSGNQLKFLFNQFEKRQQILNEQSLTPDGQIIRSSTLKNLDKGYEFMPRNAKQVGANQIIIPCMLRSYLCFAKIDY